MIMHIGDRESNLDEVEPNDFLTESRLTLPEVHQKIRVWAVFKQKKLLRLILDTLIFIYCVLLK